MAEMIGIDAAQALVRSHTEPNDALPLRLREALGRVLAEDVTSDIDSPPYDKSLVDGYAIRTADLADGPRRLHVLEEVAAGAVPQYPVRPGSATRIMTGAPLPTGADAVVMVEQTLAVAGESSQVEVRVGSIKSGSAIMRQGASVRRGQLVLQSGCQLRSVEIGVLAEVGRETANVIRQPQVALVQTGDELVVAGQPLLPGQIRNSNGPMIAAMVERAGASAVDLGIARDDERSLSAAIREGLRSDLLIVSGGVSAGVKDLVPIVFANEGVRQVFHRVNMRPGKPVWFGVADSAGRRTLVFGLPGNPVSSLACFWVFVAAAIAGRAGRAGAVPLATARLATSHTLRGSRPTYWPAQQQQNAAVQPLNWQGSADLCSLAQADCLIFFPEGNRIYAADQQVSVLPLQ